MEEKKADVYKRQAIYRVPGVVATLSLIIYTTLVLFLVSVYDLTLTLPGIAGIIPVSYTHLDVYKRQR